VSGASVRRKSDSQTSIVVGLSGHWRQMLASRHATADVRKRRLQTHSEVLRLGGILATLVGLTRCGVKSIDRSLK
jgi:hypothetical protein